MTSRKSIFLARTISLIIPGLGLIYVGKYFKGMIWMLIGLPLIALEIIVIKMILNLYAIGGHEYFIHRQRPTSSAITIGIGYFLCCIFSSKEAVRDTVEYNARQKELE